MSVALALILLADAATSCTPADVPPLAGGATLVLPVGKPDPVPFERLGPATGLPKSDAIEQTAAEKKQADEAGGEPVADSCEALPIHFV